MNKLKGYREKTKLRV